MFGFWPRVTPPFPALWPLLFSSPPSCDLPESRPTNSERTWKLYGNICKLTRFGNIEKLTMYVGSHVCTQLIPSQPGEALLYEALIPRNTATCIRHKGFSTKSVASSQLAFVRFLNLRVALVASLRCHLPTTAASIYPHLEGRKVTS